MNLDRMRSSTPAIKRIAGLAHGMRRSRCASRERVLVVRYDISRNICRI